ncbi:Ig-like domain repeat protein, partial [uncultured Methanobrevibacter sp.]|uniref:beta strand repeat-containing protein n=1 Tax=uncultured Methanobrevibacter sp. TaxID=253161 RepID=UPI0025D41B38
MYKYLLNFFKYGDGNIKLNKPILAILTLLILLIFIGTVSAMEDNANNETSVLSAVNNDEIVAINNSQEMLSAGQPATFADLAVDVGNGGDKNLGGKIYTYEGGSSVIGSFITISEPGTIDGQGAVIDANGANFRLFSVNTNNVIFKNITFKNVNSLQEGPVILFTGGGTLEDCTFADNTAGSGAGGAVYFTGEGTVKNCNFTHNAASGNHAGALYFYDVGTVINSNFIDNSASGTTSGNGGAIYFNSRGTVINSNFRGNNATTKKGGAVYFTGQGTLTGCNFTSNSASEGGAVYFENDGNVTGCNFTDNSVSGYAGAVYFKYTGMVNNSNFTNNIADKGNGAIYFSDPGSVDNSNFIHNIAKDGDGGAVYFKRSGNVTNSNFINNTALTPPQKTNGRGGAINFNNSDNAVGRVENCNFNNNSAKFIAGAIYVGKVGVILDSNFTNNFVFNGSGGGAVYFDTSSTGEIKRSNFENNNLTTGKFTQGNPGGGAVYFGGSLSSLDYCNFTNNFVSNNCSGGGAVHFENFGNITNCNFASNYVTGKCQGGGAVHLLKSANIDNCNFTDNHIDYVDSNGGAIHDVNSNYGDMTNITNSNFYNNGASSAGGAVYIYHALGNVVGCNFTDNYALHGGAVHFELAGNVDMSNFIHNRANSGGAVDLDNLTGSVANKKSLNINNSNFTSNTAKNFAGAVFCHGANILNVENSNFIDNHGNRGNGGGAIYTEDEGHISGSEFINNSGGYGGAVYLQSGDVSGCNFTNNSGASGGAAYIYEQGNIVDCNFVHNNATSDGGAAYINGQGTVDNCNFADNIAYGKINGGGAIYLVYGDVKSSNFNNNRAYRGGAIYFFSSSNIGSVDNSNFTNCSSSSSGGAVYFNTVGSVDNSSFNNCSSTSGSGGAVFFNKVGSVDNSNFTNCSSSTFGGAVYFSNDGSVDKSIFTNCSSSSYGGAVYFSNDGSVDKSIFTNCSSSGFGGAVYFNKAGSVNNSNFTCNRANAGSTIYLSSQSGSDTKSVKNSILLNNKARSYSLTFSRKGANAFITFAGGDNLLNAIYSGSDVDFDNVTYWGVYGVNNTDTSSVSRSSNEVGQNITVTINHDGDVVVRDMVTDVNGQVSFDLAPGHYAISAVHPDDLYYTGISQSYDELDLYPTVTNVSVNGLTAQARVEPSRVSGNVTFIVTNESGTVKNETVNIQSATREYAYVNLDLSDLNLGKYNITAVYNGNNRYLPSNNTTSFELVPVNSTVIIITDDIVIGDEELIEVKINDKVQPITIYVDGVPYDGPNYRSYWVVPDLPVGIHRVEVYYPGNGKYLPATNSSSFAVIGNKDYYVTAHNNISLLNYPVNITADSDLPNTNLTKKMYFTIYKDDQEFDFVEATLGNDGIWWTEYTFYTSDGFSENSNVEIEPYYGSDTLYNINYINGKIALRYGAPFNIAAEDVDYGNKVNITIDLPFDVQGNVTFYIGDKNYSIENMRGNPKYFIIPDIFAAGQYTVNAVYSGDGYYPANTTTTTFNVNRAAPTITINASDIVVGNNAIINATLPENATGKILLIVNGTEYEVDSGESISVPNLNVGPYEVVAIYDGDQNYTSGHAFKSFNVIKRNLNISLDEVTDKIQVGSPVTLTARLNETVTGYVVFTINDVNHTVSISNANYTTYDYTPVDNSPLTVVATFPGNDRFNSNKSAPMTLTVNGIPTNVTVSFDSPVFVGNDVEITIKLNVSIDTTVKLKINDTVRDVVILGGTGTYTTSNLVNDTYTITATFEGNERYAGNSSEPKTLKVNKVPTNITVSTNSPIVVGETAVITINMQPSVNAIVKLRVNGKTYYVAVVNGVGTYNVSGLAANDGYDVNVTFDGDSKYLYATNNTTLVVNKIADYPLNVTTENIVFGDNETITVILPVDINKDNLVIKVDGNVKTPVSVVNGVATVVVPGLAVGQHEVNVTYNDDGKYVTKNNNSNMFTVSPSPICDIALNVNNKTYGEDTTFTVTLPGDVTENVTISIDGKDFSVKPDAQGVATLTMNNLTGGLHRVTASYPGDSIYSANSTSATFIIGRAASSIDVEFTTPKFVGDDVLINVSMGQKINGTVILSVGDNNYTVAVTDGNGSYVVSGLTNTTYDVKAEFKGNENYTTSVSNVKQLAIDKVPTTIAVAVNATINVGQVAVVNVTIDKKLNGSAVVSVNGENHTVAIIDGNGTLTLANLASGTYYINATFKGDNQYVGSTSNTATLTVNKIAADISVSVNSPIKVGETAVVTINMNPTINATVKLRVNGKTYYVAVVDGVGTYNVSGLAANGGYDVNVTFDGDSKYLYATNNTTLVVNKIADYPLNVTPENIVFGDDETIIITLPADINKDNLVIKVDGVAKDPVSVVNGVATVLVPGLTVGQHEVNVTYLGDDKYDAKNNNSNMFTVSPSPNCNIVLDVNNKTYGEDTTFTVTLPSDVTENVTISIGGKDYSVKPNDQGVATLTLNNLTGGLHAVTASYPGDSIYSANSTSATFVIPRAASTIYVEFTTPKSVGDDVLINVSMGQKINGTVILSVGDNNYNVAVTDGNGSYVVSGLTNTTYDVKAEFKGNENYTASVSDVKPLMINKVPISIVVAVNATINVGETAVVNVTIDKKLNGSAVVSVNGENHTVAIIDGNGTLTLTNLASGTYYINAIFKGDNQYVGSTSNTATLTVNKIATHIEVSVKEPVTYGEDAVIYIELDVPINTTAKLTVDDYEYYVAVINGKGEFNASGLVAGPHEVNVTYAGDVKYVGSKDNATFTVNKVDTKAVIDDIVTDLTNNVTSVTVNITDKDGNLVKVSGNVTITIENESGVVKTVISDEFVGFDVTVDLGVLAPGKYNITAVYKGNDNYANSTNDTREYEVPLAT